MLAVLKSGYTSEPINHAWKYLTLSLPVNCIPCVRFATLEHSGLLIYNGRLNEKHDFLAVEIVDGQVQLKYSTGEYGQ